MSDSLSIRAYLLQGLIAITCFASIPMMIRLVSADPMTIGFVRLVIAVSFGSFILAKPQDFMSLKYKDWLWLAIIGVSFGVHWLAYFYSIKLSSAAVAVVGVSSYGMQVILISIIFHSRPFYTTDALAIGLVLIGTLMALPEFSLENEMTQGFLLGIFSAFFYAILPSFHQKNEHMTSGVRSLGQFGFAGLFFAAFLPWMNFDLSLLDWGGLLYLGLIATLVGHTLWIKFTTKVSAVPSSLMYYMSVPIAIALGSIFLQEEVTLALIIGALLIILGNIVGMSHQMKSNSFFIKK